MVVTEGEVGEGTQAEQQPLVYHCYVVVIQVPKEEAVSQSGHQHMG